MIFTSRFLPNLVRLVTLLIVLIVLPQSIFAAPNKQQSTSNIAPADVPVSSASPGIERIGYTQGEVVAIEVVGSTAYAVDLSQEISIFNVADPSKPVRIGGLRLPSKAHKLQVLGTTLYAAGSNEFYSIGLTSPQAPTLLATYTTPGLLTGFHVVGGRAYLSVNENGLYVIDVSNPSSPVALGNIAIDFPSAVFVSNNRAYVADTRWVNIIDVTDPAHPALLGKYDTGFNTADIAVEGNNAYLVIESGNTGVVQVLDVSDSASPSLRSTYPQNPTNHTGGKHIRLVGNRVYVTTSAGVLVLNKSNAAQLTLLGQYDATSISGFAVQNTTAYLARFIAIQGTEIIDLANPSSPATLGAIPATGRSGKVAVRNNRAYLGWDGLKTFDTSSLSMPSYLSGPVVAEENGIISGMQFVDNNLYTTACISSDATNYSLLRIYDLTDAVNPSILSTLRYSTPGCATDVAVVGTTAYIVDRAKVLKVIDVSDPLSPTLVLDTPTSGETMSIQVVGTKAYLANGESGLQVFDLTNPVSPTAIAQLDTPGNAQDVDVVGSVAYVADHSDGIHLVDVSDPQNPTLVRTIATSGFALEVKVDGDLAYIREPLALEVVDITETSGSPRRGSYIVENFEFWVDADTIYISSRSGGLHILRVTPEQLVTYQYNIYLPLALK